MPENKVWYLGVDPGSAKTGFAWVEADGRIKGCSTGNRNFTRSAAANIRICSSCCDFGERH